MTRNWLKIAVTVACTTGACLFAGEPAIAQQYPTRLVRIVAPFPPGNASDIVARLVADHLSRRLSQPVVVENKPGATGAIGAVFVAKAPADGYTLLMTSTSFAINTAVTAQLPYDIARDFEPVALLGWVGMVLVVNPSFPAENLEQFAAMVRRSPGKYSYANVGRGSIQHLTMELFLSALGADVVGVPYKGSAQGMTEVMAGVVPMMFDAISSAGSFVKSGKVRALATAGTQRSSILPNVPATGEAGIAVLKDFNVTGWVGLLAPAGTPKAIVQRLNAEVGAIVQLPEVKEKLAFQGLEVYPPAPPEAFADYLKAQTQRWAAAATAAKLQKE